LSSPFFHPRPQKSKGTEWAIRLIPGAAAIPPRKKPQRAVDEKSAFSSLHGVGPFPDSTPKTAPSFFLFPWRQAPHARSGKGWAGSILIAFVPAILSWSALLKISLQLHTVFPLPVLLSGFARTASISPALVGIALLHGSLIRLSGYPQRLAVDHAGSRRRIRNDAVAVLRGTLLLSATLQFHGLPAAGVATVWAAGILNFALWSAWQWGERAGNRRGLLATCGPRNVLIVGAGQLGRRIADHIGNHPELDRSVCGFLDDSRLSAKDVLGPTRNLAELARTGFIDEVILAAPQDREVTARVLHQARRLRLDVKLAPDLFGCDAALEVENVGAIPLISLHEEQLPVVSLLLKRSLDVVVAASALVLTAPVLTALAFLVKLDSPGPALYAAPRAGRKGRPFRCYKFRTMVRNADDLKQTLLRRNERQGPFFKITADPRVTRLGRFVRRYSLDELPQLFNVLKGEMSLVGPRPHPMDDFSAYAIDHLPRLDVRPGMTGLWQVTARRDPSFQAGMNLDLEYINRWSLAMDLRILLKTAGAVLRGSGE